MKYMLLIYDDEKAFHGMADEEKQKIYAEYGQLQQSMQAAGQFVSGSELQPVSTATLIRVRGGKPLVTDGPFAETREQLGGYFIVDAPDLDAAIALAARIPSARSGTVEVRPLQSGGM